MDSEAKLAVVKDLRETKSKHDVVLDGKIHYFRPIVNLGGVTVRYVQIGKVKDFCLPGYIASYNLDPEAAAEVDRFSRHVTLTRWERFFGIPLRWKVRRAVEKAKVELRRFYNDEKKRKQIIESLEV